MSETKETIEERYEKSSKALRAMKRKDYFYAFVDEIDETILLLYDLMAERGKG